MPKPRLYLSPPHMSGEERSLVDEVFAQNWIAPVGPHLERFEGEFAQYIGVQHAVAVISGTAALHLILRHLGVQAGQEVVCSTFTFCASANPIVYERGVPVFIDSEAASWNLDPNLLDDELASCARRGSLPRAIVAVDILGQSADMDAVCEVAARFDVPVVEDAAEALGARYKGRAAGSSAWASFFSFNGNKIITTSGGGMICTNDAELAEHTRFLATQARDPASFYLHSQLGFNYRLSNLLAAVGIGQLRVLDQRVKKRHYIRDRYFQAMSQWKGVSFMPVAPFGRPNFWLTAITINADEFGASCDDVRLHLESHNIEARRLWKPLHTQPLFAGARAVGGAVAEELFRAGLSLPSGSAMSDDDIDRVINAIQELRA